MVIKDKMVLEVSQGMTAEVTLSLDQIQDKDWSDGTVGSSPTARARPPITS